ncbi:hypothetical protein ALP35_200157 [Pseudomonas savastanoi pv. glycinea]|nr:hypothetical protein ALP35_200157 [Pseudomonas savastanoi pv. glycinea]
MDNLIDVLECFLVRREHDTEACQVRDLTLVDLAVEQRQLMLKAIVVATNIAQGAGDVSNRSATSLAQRKCLIGTVCVGIDQQLQATLHVVLAVELGHALEANLGIQRFDLPIAAQQTLPAVLIIVEQWQQVIHGIINRVHERRAERQIRRQQLAAT